MSNNVQIPTTVGSPTTTIETIDEGDGVERQVIVLGSIGDASGETQLSAGQKTSANSIPVVVASDQSSISANLVASQNDIGNVGGKTVAVTVTPIVTASNSYGTNYVVGGLLTFSNAFTSTGTGILQDVVVTISGVETSGFTFFPFSANPSNSTWTDAAIANINSADVTKVRGAVSLTGNSQLGTHTVAYAYGLGHALAPGSSTLYGILIANAALTNQFASISAVTVTVVILQDC